MEIRQARVLTALDTLTCGDHVGWILKQPTQFAEQAALCLQQGAAAGQKLFYFGPGRGAGPQLLPIGDGVTVLDPYVTFLHGGGLDATAMYAGFRREAARADAEGYRGLRIVADMDWLQGPHPSGGQIAAFEQGLDAVVAETGATIVCAYRRESFPHRDLAGVMCVHPHVLGTAPKDLGFRVWSSGEGRWHLAGQVDLRVAEEFGAVIRTAAEGRTSLWLDCSRLRFIDVAGIRALARAARSTGVSMRLHGASETLQRSWKLLEWDSVVPNVEFSV
ncbi:MAG: MEDS domain-containing protein [Catenulispora sp.]